MTGTRSLLFFGAAMLMFSLHAVAQDKQTVWSDQEKPIVAQLRGLRAVPDDQRGSVTRQLARQIRDLPAGENKVKLANALAGLSTEGDFGQDTLQEAAATLADALREKPLAAKENSDVPYPYVELAQLVRYEHVHVSLDSPLFSAALSKLEAEDHSRREPDFTLADLQGKLWTLHELRGKVVLVNFWATWCPPCRKEMPDLEALYARFKEQGFVVLAISDEDAGKVKPFIAEHNFAYPILLDPGRKVNEQFHIGGIPRSFVYDRDGKLAAQSIDMRTQKQFLEMLAQAGLR